MIHELISISCSNSVMTMFASSGPSEPPMLTPSVCSYSLLLQETTVPVHVSQMSLRFKDRFLELRFHKLLVVDSI